MLQLLIGTSDLQWLGPLLDDGTLDADDVMAGAANGHRPVLERVPQLTALGTVRLPRGVAPASVASLAMFGGWTGNESDSYEQLRLALESLPALADASAEAVRQAGVEVFAAHRDEAWIDELRRSIRGEL